MEVRQSVNGLRELRVFEGVQKEGDGMIDEDALKLIAIIYALISIIGILLLVIVCVMG